MKQLATSILAAVVFIVCVICEDTISNTTVATFVEANTTIDSVNNVTTTTADVSNVTVMNAPDDVNKTENIGTNNNETAAKEFLEQYNLESGQNLNTVTLKEWNMDTNITDYNEELLIKQETISAKFAKDMRVRALTFNVSAMTPDTQRQLNKITDIGVSAQPNETKVEELSKVMSSMESIYSKAVVCLTKNECLPLEPNITSLLTTSRDYDQLLTLWTGWRNETGRKMKTLFTRYVELNNEAVQILGYKDAGEEWRSVYESDTIVDELKDLFDQVTPLYQQLHAFVRRRLKKVYGDSKFPASGHIPAHLLGNMWAQEWDSILDLLKPFENKTALDVTSEMIRQNYTVDTIFRTAEDFFVSLGFDEMVPSFWNMSMLEKPTDGRDVVCHASAWDFYDAKDFRIKMCTVINQQDLMTVHHEMGHIEYFMQYRNQEVIYRDGANDGFHEAIGDLMTLSVQTPEHMKKLNLIEEISTDGDVDINFLMNMALQKVAFLPFGYLIDQWRWSVFAGTTTPDKYNKDWWNLRCHLQGVSPPVARSEEDFDAGAKYHVAAGVPYMRYFISFIIQFQFHKAACQAANYSGPLHRCDIYNNTAAGQKLRDVLKLGSSKPWPEAMKMLTGQDKMSAEPLMEYFKPLLHFLREQNGDDYGWDLHCPDFTKEGTNPGTTPPTCPPNGGGEKVSGSILVLVIVFVIKLY